MESYITYAPFLRRHIISEVRCKGECRTVLVQRRGPGQNLRLDKTNDYGEIVLEMLTDTGLLGKHETAMCFNCRQRLRAGGARPGELRDIYAQDVHQWIEDAVMQSGLAPADAEAMAAQFAGFVPVRVLDEPSRGDTYYG